MIVIEMILMGIFTTYFMDLIAGVLVKRKLIHSYIGPEAVGRWFLYMFRGKFIHKDIQKTPEWYIDQQKKYEKAVESSVLPVLQIETNVLPDKRHIEKILGWIGE